MARMARANAIKRLAMLGASQQRLPESKRIRRKPATGSHLVAMVGLSDPQGSNALPITQPFVRSHLRRRGKFWLGLG